MWYVLLITQACQVTAAELILTTDRCLSPPSTLPFPPFPATSPLSFPSLSISLFPSLSPNPARRARERCELPPAGSGAELQPKIEFGAF